MSAMSDSCTCFVGNLPWTMTNEDLAQFMSSAGGQLASAEVQAHADTGRSKGWGLVTFVSADQANLAAQHLNETERDGRQLTVRIDRGPTEKTGGGGGGGGGNGGGNGGGGGGAMPASLMQGSSVYVGNLPWTCTDEELLALAGGSGAAPVSAEVKTAASGKSRGFGILEYGDNASAERAVTALNGADFQGRDLTVRLDRPAPARNGKAAGGGGGAAKPKKERVVSNADAPPSCVVYVNNLSWTSTDEGLFEHCSRSGVTPGRAEIQMSGTRSKGWGLVTYNSVADAQRALAQLEGSTLDDRQLFARFDAGNQ